GAGSKAAAICEPVHPAAGTDRLGPGVARLCRDRRRRDHQAFLRPLLSQACLLRPRCDHRCSHGSDAAVAQWRSLASLSFFSCDLRTRCWTGLCAVDLLERPTTPSRGECWWTAPVLALFGRKHEKTRIFQA